MAQKYTELQSITSDPDATDSEAALDAAKQEAIKERRTLWKRLAIVFSIILSDAVCLSVILPFVPEMCRTTFGMREDLIGMAGGALVGIFSLAQFISSFIIGHWSDIYGRKLLMMAGLFSGFVGTLVFAFATNFWVAFISRLAQGLTNGNVAVAKACVSDLTVKAAGTDRTLAFAYFGATFSLGRVVSSAAGGLFYGVYLFGYENPYLLPCIIGSLANLICFIITGVIFPETMKGKKKAETDSSLIKGLKLIVQDKLMLKLVAISSVNSFSNGALLLNVLLIQTLKVEYHGLGFSALDQGISSGFFGGVAALFQFFIFPIILKRYDIYRIYSKGVIVLGSATILMPTANLVYWFSGSTATFYKVLTWSILLPFTCLMSVGFMTCLPVAGTMLSNASPADRQGLVQGSSASISSLLRAIGPLLAGMIFTFSVSINFPFLLPIVLGLSYFACWWMIRSFSEEEKAAILKPSAGKKSQEKELLVAPTPEEEESRTEDSRAEEESKAEEDISPSDKA
eukprot:Phypoly_transcript_04950.p1 GENE.Phypoly_transcript_04950~~Phypoly_transcript_04950.p1  ORF type:complete len:513 (+),score=52.93 Phypoly_transcript_04950:61-1599(+)